MQSRSIAFISKLIVASLLLSMMLVAVSLAQSHAAESPKRVDVLIGFTKQPGPNEQALVRSHGGSIKYTYRLVPAIAASLPEAAIAGLSKNPNITRIDLDGKVYAIGTELDNTWGVKQIGSGTVHSGGNKGAGTKVAVIDSGIDYDHPELKSNYAGGHDFVNKDGDPMDDNGHGTHVAGTVAAALDGNGVVGVAPEAKIYALKVLDKNGSGYWSDIIAALQWAVDQGIQVTNNSYGSGSNPGGLVEDAFIKADAAGIVNVAAAGNAGNAAGKGSNVGYPARYNSVIAVAATDKNDVRAYFSSTGEQVEISAPGVGINSTKLGGGYIEYNGTSMASPHVAGAAALVIAAGITDSNGNGRVNDEVRQVLNETAKDLGDAGRDTKYGYGLVDAAAAVATVVPPSPSVNVVLSSDKTNYVSGTDTTAVLTAVVTNEKEEAISGLSETAFVTTLNGTTATVAFAPTSRAGTYAANLDISGLADGQYNIEVEVTDTRSLSGTGSATISIGSAPSNPTIVSVVSVSYATEGGKGGNKDLLVTVALRDDFGNQVAGASVSIILSRLDQEGGTVVNSYTGAGTTGVDGSATFKLKNAPAGYYTTTVTEVTAGGLTWDEITPANGFSKQ